MTVRQEAGAIPTGILQHLVAGACHTMDKLAETLPFDRRQISDGVGKLIMRGYVERVDIGCYQLTSEGIAAKERGEVITSGPIHGDTAPNRKPRKGTMRERAWTAMRMSGTFTIGEIVMAAARDEADPASNLQRYLRILKSAGYVAELPTREKGTRLTSNGFKRFRLLKNTGPIAPVWTPKRQAVLDFNLAARGKEIPCKSN